MGNCWILIAEIRPGYRSSPSRYLECEKNWNKGRAPAFAPLATGRICGGHLKAYGIHRGEIFNMWFLCKFREALKGMHVSLNQTLYPFDIYLSISCQNPRLSIANKPILSLTSICDPILSML